MHHTQRALIYSCKELGLTFRFLSSDKSVIGVTKNNVEHLFFPNVPPLNSVAIQRLFRDKMYTYELLSSYIKMPISFKFIDPNAPEYLNPYKKHINIESISIDIIERFKFPIIIKMNSGSAGKNVFLCKNIKEIKSALNKIYNQESKNYDPIAIAQDYIEITEEFRAIFVNSSIELLYKKNIEYATYAGNLSPLHWENATAEIITNTDIIKKLNSFLRPIFSKYQIKYGGADIAIDKNENKYLIELNACPSFSIFMSDNNLDPLIKLYISILRTL